MNLDELRSVQEKERRKDSLQHLRDTFYDDVATYIADLRAARDRRAEQVEDPFSDDEVRQMSDEIETAEEVAEALYERRVGKVVKLASFAAAGMPAEEEGLTSQEQSLFDDIVARIESNKTSVLDVIAGDADVPTSEATAGGGRAESDSSGRPTTERNPTDRTPGSDPMTGDEPAPDADLDGSIADATPPDDGGMLADAMGEGSDSDPSTADDDDHYEVSPEQSETAPPDAPTEASTDAPAESPSDAPTTASTDAPAETDEDRSDRSDDASGESAAAEIGTERTTVRVTEDVGEIFGVDEREYELVAEDVVTLPEANAEPLLQRDAAEKID